MGAIIAWQNYVAAAGVTTNSTNAYATLPPERVLTPQLGDVCRIGLSTGASHRLRVDLGQTRSDLRLFIAAAPRDGILPSAASTARFVASNVAQDGEEALNVFTAQPHSTAGLWYIRNATAVVARWVHWRVLGGVADTYWQVGRLWAGPIFETAANVSAQDFARGGAVGGTRTRSLLTGVIHADPAAKPRRQRFTIARLTEAEAAQVDLCAQEAGTTTQVFVAHNAPGSTAATSGALGHFVQPPMLRRVAVATWSASFDFMEDL